MNLTQFIKTYLGKKIDFDGNYGYQCVDLYRQYCKDVLEVNQSPSVKAAKEIFDKPGELIAVADSKTTDYSVGDILVWDNGREGHVAILVAIYNTKYFVVLEQDGYAQDGVKLNFRSREGLRGYLWKKVG